MNDKEKTVRLLVVNDTQEFNEALQASIDMNSHVYDLDCECVVTGEEALERIEKWQPSVILLDAHLPDLNSLSILDQSDPEETKVIITSTHHSTEIRDTALSRGAEGYFPMEQDIDLLEQLIEYVVVLATASEEAPH